MSRTEKLEELKAWYETTNPTLPLQAYLEVGEIDLSLKKWSTEAVKEFVKHNANLNEKYKVEVILTKDEFNAVKALLSDLGVIPYVSIIYKKEQE